MGFDQKQLGRRLRGARENRGLTQEQAAEAIGVARYAIVRIERGERSVSTLELSKLAELYGCSVGDFFRDSEGQSEDVLVTLFRALPGLDERPDVKAQVTRQLELCREGLRLEDLLDISESRPPVPHYGLRNPGSVMTAVRQGESIAEEERKRLGLSDAPVFDVADLIAGQGIWASGADLPDDVSGVFVHHASVGMAILVNVFHTRSRKRFSYAHEYAHALMDRGRTVTISSRENASDLAETRANAFAASFLMPAGGVHAFMQSREKGGGTRRTYSVYGVSGDEVKTAEQRSSADERAVTYEDIASLAHHFGTSYVAAVYRALNLKYIARNQSDDLIAKESLANDYLAILGYDDVDPARQPDRDLVGHVAQLTIEARRRGEISRGRLFELAKLLGIDGSRLERLAEAA